MPGRLTRLFSSPHFSKRDDAYWMVFLTYTNCEKGAKTRPDKYGIENYLPLFTIRNEVAKKPCTELQLSNTIFARCDLHQYPGLRKPGNFIYEQPTHPDMHEGEVQVAMESCWQIERPSELFDVERVKSTVHPGMPCRLTSGPLSGSEGYCDDTQTFFFLPLPEMDTYAKLPLSAKYVVADGHRVLENLI